MALIVEDGTGIQNADSYVSVLEADAYHEAFGNPDWATLAQSKKEQLLRRATEFMVGRYRARWKGWRCTQLQALDWPRQGVVLNDIGYDTGSYNIGTYQYIVPNNIVPIEVRVACFKLAMTANTEDLNPDGQQKVLMEKVGSLMIQYDPNSPNVKQFRSVVAAIAPYFEPRSSGCSVRLERA